uniref:Uncharacterized protein n=1 Tax=Arundo donax TaxID=35708 RepID=A0A0A9GN64_ARUDO
MCRSSAFPSAPPATSRFAFPLHYPSSQLCPTASPGASSASLPTPHAALSRQAAPIPAVSRLSLPPQTALPPNPAQPRLMSSNCCCCASDAAPGGGGGPVLWRAAAGKHELPLMVHTKCSTSGLHRGARVSMPATTASAPLSPCSALRSCPRRRPRRPQGHHRPPSGDSRRVFDAGSLRRCLRADVFDGPHELAYTSSTSRSPQKGVRHRVAAATSVFQRLRSLRPSAHSHP